MTGARHKKIIYAIMIRFAMHPDKKNIIRSRWASITEKKEGFGI